MEGAQDEYAIKYVILTQEILCDKQLNAVEKLILARMSGFSEFFEAATTTAELLGTTERVVKDTKRKLLKLGYIKEKANTGRGKVYEICPEMYIRPTKKCISDVRKSVSQSYEKTYIENKERINIEHSNGENEKKEAVEKSEYGNPQVNEILALWDDEVGIPAKRDQATRRAAWTLIQKQGIEGARSVLKLIGRSIREGDRYAPQIASLRDLWGKYGKLDKLLIWAKRNEAQIETEPTPPYYLNNDTPAEPEISDEEREKVLKMFKEKRGELFGGVK